MSESLSKFNPQLIYIYTITQANIKLHTYDQTSVIEKYKIMFN